MKTTILATIMVLGTVFANGQVELKGVKLGEKGNDEMTLTTLGGVSGAIVANNLNDSTTYSIVFIPTTDGETVDWISETETERLKNGMEVVFGIKFRKIKSSEYSNDFKYGVIKNGVFYVIKVEVNQFMPQPNSVVIIISNQRLYKISKDEEQQKANSDF